MLILKCPKKTWILSRNVPTGIGHSTPMSRKGWNSYLNVETNIAETVQENDHLF